MKYKKAWNTDRSKKVQEQGEIQKYRKKKMKNPALERNG